MTITPVSSIPATDYERVRSGALYVFWQTASSSDFATVGDKAAFCYRYFDYYWYHAPDYFNVARDEDGVAGYICGVAQTRSHPELYLVADHIPLFDDLYAEYPAHLHINVHDRTRGRGLGSRLIEAFVNGVRRDGAAGVHLVTSVGARNVQFYRKNGFDMTVSRPFDLEKPVVELLFMGKRLV